MRYMHAYLVPSLSLRSGDMALNYKLLVVLDGGISHTIAQGNAGDGN